MSRKKEKLKVESGELETQLETVETVELPLPNIAFVGKESQLVFDEEKGEKAEKLLPSEVPSSVATPRGVIEIPSTEWGKGFYLEPYQAEYLKRVFPKLFKTPLDLSDLGGHNG